jgi:hypothetical protein
VSRLRPGALRSRPQQVPGGLHDDRPGERGQGLVEFALILPIFMFLLLIMLEFGLAFGHTLSIGVATREGARTGAALANSGLSSCAGGQDPNDVDEQIISGAQKILKSPGSDVAMADISQIRIYKADAAGNQIGAFVNVWTYTPGAGPDADKDPIGVDRLDFSPPATQAWPVCSRLNGAAPDSVGVEIRYTYRLQTALSGFVNTVMRGSQGATITMNDRTVMVLNPGS